MILVKNLIMVSPADKTPIREITLRRMPTVPTNEGLYDLLNLFQEGRRHMAMVVDPRDHMTYKGVPQTLHPHPSHNLPSPNLQAHASLCPPPPPRPAKNNAPGQFAQNVCSSTAAGGVGGSARNGAASLVRVCEPTTPPQNDQHHLAVIFGV